VAVTAWIVVIAVDREDRYGNVDVGVFVVYMGEGAFEYFVGVAEKLELARSVTKTVLAERSHDLVHGFSGWLVVVEEVTPEQDHVDLRWSA
jgi:hypothetical protein